MELVCTACGSRVPIREPFATLHFARERVEIDGRLLHDCRMGNGSRAAILAKAHEVRERARTTVSYARRVRDRLEA
jgi:hypothetical protein